ncbi:MAG: cytochrome c biogenesis protein ResB [Ruminococcaceae bacterium]|nr:cytochrome c biogenesis protein ResB [Oscillospiraceae bacterium]
MRFYKISCAILAFVFVIVLILTLLSNQTHYREADPASVTKENCVYYYIHVDDVKEMDGSLAMPGGYVMVAEYLSLLYKLDPAEASRLEMDYTQMGTFYETYLLFDGTVLYILLGVVAVLLIICVCISQVYGQKTYKIGFFVLHGGLALLLVGFIFQNLLGQSISFVLDVDGRYPRGTETVYTDMKDAQNQMDLGFQISATYMKVSYYPETNMVREYDLTVETRKGPDDVQPVAYKLKVNKPIYINGYKIYLMNYADNAVVLTAKYDPMEYTILFGIFATLAGTVIMCLFRKDGGSDVQ